MLTQAGVLEQDQWGNSALMLASRYGKTGIVEKLLAAGAKAETTDEVHWRRGWWAGDVRWERSCCAGNCRRIICKV